jgi:Icc protein
MTSKKILIISDTHFSKDNTLLFGKYDVEKSFNRLASKIKQEQPDAIILSGDISQDGSVESYLKMQEYLTELPGHKYYIMGNHDSANISYLNNSTISSPDYVDIDKHRFIFISSYKGIGYDDGLIDDSELNKIKQYALPSGTNYIVVHHHFINADSIIDSYILENKEQFCKLLESHPIAAVFHGHVHNSYVKKLSDIYVYANPSTCVQFAVSSTLKLEPVIGYRVITLDDNRYNTYVYNETF